MSTPTEPETGEMPAVVELAVRGSDTESRPPIRWAAIVWGTIVAAIAVAVLTVLGSNVRRQAFADWLGGLGVGGFVMLGILAVGIFILILAALALIRRAQRAIDRT